MLATQHLKNQKGMAALEIIPITIVIVLLLSFSYGFFGVIHTGILNSVASRNYAFETFNHRADLRYFRSSVEAKADSAYHVQAFRIHGIASNRRPASDPYGVATARDISFGWSFGRPDEFANNNPNYHNRELFEIKDDGTRYTAREGVNPVWIQTTYGICMNVKCEPE